VAGTWTFDRGPGSVFGVRLSVDAKALCKSSISSGFGTREEAAGPVKQAVNNLLRAG
jgi:hypothetical protein